MMSHPSNGSREERHKENMEIHENTTNYDSADLLEGSEMTQPTDGSVSEDETSGWLGSMSTDFRHIANCFKDSTLPVIGGVASLVHKTAMTVAAEIAQLEKDGEMERNIRRPEDDRGTESLALPWEIRHEGEKGDIPIYVTDGVLMDAILALSLEETTFSTPFEALESRQSNGGQDFILDESRVSQIRRLLDIDENLATVHAQSSGKTKVQENIFWKNYFYHCEKTRRKYVENRLPSRHGTEKIPRSDYEVPTVSADSHRNNEEIVPDDASLVPASVTDDSSLRIAPSPNSADTFTTTQSFDDLVIVGRETECEYDEM